MPFSWVTETAPWGDFWIGSNLGTGSETPFISGLTIEHDRDLFLRIAGVDLCALALTPVYLSLAARLDKRLHSRRCFCVPQMSLPIGCFVAVDRCQER